MTLKKDSPNKVHNRSHWIWCSTAGALVALFCVVTFFVNSQDGGQESVVASRTSWEARAPIAMCEDPSIQVGAVELIERDSEEGVKLVDVYISVEGLAEEAGKHAVHIHETGSCTPCSDAGGHFDPGPHGHTNPDGNHPFHSGDLVNIEVNDFGDGELITMTSRITLSPGPLSIFDTDGASLIIHVDPDTYCPGGEEAGCAGGARLACGIFELVKLSDE